MNIGIRLHDTAPGTLEQRLGFAQRQGFTCAHLALSKTLTGFDMLRAPELMTDELADTVKSAFAAHRQQCAVLGCYLNLADPDGETRGQLQEIYKAHLRFARKIGATVVGTETNAPKGARFSGPVGRSEEAFRLFVDALRPLVRCAEETGVCLAVEPVSAHIISTPERAQRMLDALPSEHLRIILDAVNLLSFDTAERAEEIVADAIRRLGDKVCVLHMKDFEPAEGKLAARACGTGRMRYEHLLAFAKTRGLPMTLENTRPDNAEAARLYLERIAAAL